MTVVTEKASVAHSPLLRQCDKYTVLERFTCKDGVLRMAYVTYERRNGEPVAVGAFVPPWSKPLEAAR